MSRQERAPPERLSRFIGAMRLPIGLTEDWGMPEFGYEGGSGREKRLKIVSESRLPRMYGFTGEVKLTSFVVRGCTQH